VTSAPDRVKELIYAAFDIHALYREDQHQLTIRAVLALSALSTPAAPATSTDAFAELMPPPFTVSARPGGVPLRLSRKFWLSWKLLAAIATLFFRISHMFRVIVTVVDYRYELAFRVTAPCPPRAAR
jgi:hypothetical protein